MSGRNARCFTFYVILSILVCFLPLSLSLSCFLHLAVNRMPSALAVGAPPPALWPLGLLLMVRRAAGLGSCLRSNGTGVPGVGCEWVL